MGRDQGTGEAAGGKQNRQHSIPSTHPTKTFWARERIPGTALLGSGRGLGPGLRCQLPYFPAMHAWGPGRFSQASFALTGEERGAGSGDHTWMLRRHAGKLAGQRWLRGR